jgi:hypothetical protein
MSNARDAKFLFAQCFGGGMFDEIDEVLGTKVPWVGGSAARHDQVSWGTEGDTYEESYDYWSDELWKLLGNGKTLSEQIELARENDPAGDKKTGANPPKTKDGTPVQEHPQTIWRNGGETITLRDKDAKSHHAILWAGKPDGKRHYMDVLKMKDEIEKQWKATGANYTVHVLFGDGKKAPTGHDLPADWNARPATQAELKKVIDELKLVMNKDEQFLFYSSDHGDQEFDVVPLVKKWINQFTERITIPRALLKQIQEDPFNNPFFRLTGRIQRESTLSVFLDSIFIGSVFRPDDYDPTADFYEFEDLTLSFSEDFLTRFKLGDDGNIIRFNDTADFNVTFQVNEGEGELDIATFGFGGITTIPTEAVPEPATMAAFGLGALALLRKKRS